MPTGGRLFVHAATHGAGSIPELPEDIRRLIWSFTFPRPVLWCTVCALVVLLEEEDGTRVSVNTHPLAWEDTPRCVSCAGYPRV